MNGCYFESLLKIPLQHGRVQQDLGDAGNSQEFLSSTNHFSLGSRLVLMHVAWNQFIWNAIHDKQQTEFAKPIYQLIQNVNVNL